MNDFVNAIKFIGNNTDLLWHKIVEHLELSGAAIGVAILDRDPARRLARPHPPRLVPRRSAWPTSGARCPAWR